jgi:hypothetical protein
MTDDPGQHITVEHVLAMTSIAKQLKAIARIAFDPRIPHDPNQSADLMVLSFTTKQCEHMDSALMLLEGEAHRDASLVSRSMLEGLAQLQWAFNGVPERTDLWFWYGVIEDWRQLRKNEERGQPADPEVRRISDELIQLHGHHYYSGETKKRIKRARESNVELVLPSNPYRREWNNVSIRSMMEQIGGLVLYDALYRHASAWIHWNPQSILRAVNRVDDHIVEGFTETDWVSAAFALQGACRGLGQSLVILDDWFQLGLADVLIQSQEQLSEATRLEGRD